MKTSYTYIDKKIAKLNAVKERKEFITKHLLSSTVLAGAQIAIGIGRDPAKAARIHQGTEEYKSETYKRALKETEEIFLYNKKNKSL